MWIAECESSEAIKLFNDRAWWYGEDDQITFERGIKIGGAGDDVVIKGKGYRGRVGITSGDLFDVIAQSECQRSPHESESDDRDG